MAIFSMYFIGVSGLRVLPLLINGWINRNFLCCFLCCFFVFFCVARSHWQLIHAFFTLITYMDCFQLLYGEGTRLGLIKNFPQIIIARRIWL